MLDPEKIGHKNPRFGEDEVKSLCGTHRLNKQQTHLAYIEFKPSGGRSIPDLLNKLMVTIDTLSPRNAECEGGFSAMSNIIADNRKCNHYEQCREAALCLYCGTTVREMESRAIRKNLAWKGKKSSSFN